MLLSRVLKSVIACGFVFGSVSAFGVPIYDEFGALPEATFGGQGIPNDEVAVSKQIVDGDVTITVAMSATQRYSNPALTNDGAGTYFATTGTNFGGAGESTIEGAKWNFNYYIHVEGANGATPAISDYQFTLLYDFDPSEDTNINTLGEIDITTLILLPDGTPGVADIPNDITTFEGSQNLLFGFLDVDTPPILSAPDYPSFDPNALGEYNFGITVQRFVNPWPIEVVAMDVQVVPEPASLFLLSLGGLALASRRRPAA